MRVRRFACFVFAVLAVPAIATADSHFADAYAGFAFGNGGSTLVGYDAAFAVPLGKPETRLHKLSLVFDNSRRSGEPEGERITHKTYLGALRYTFPAWKGRNLFHVEYLAGAVDTTGGLDDGNSAVPAAFGAAYDLVCTQPQTVGTETKYLGWTIRAQFKAIDRKGDGKGLVQGSVGLAYRWGGRY